MGPPENHRDSNWCRLVSGYIFSCISMALCIASLSVNQITGECGWNSFWFISWNYDYLGYPELGTGHKINGAIWLSLHLVALLLCQVPLVSMVFPNFACD